MSLMRSVKVLTLNSWGIPVPLVCKYRHERIQAIGESLARGDYDIVLLQEIWSQTDYEKLCAKLLTGLPFTHYFHSGVLGTGTCIFSKHPIIGTFQYNFSLNGHPHKVQHSDWVGNKAVGLAKILMDGIRLNVYTTHLHACYNHHHPGSCEYLAHRVSQAYQLSEFVRLTSETCDAVIVGGDFNWRPHELGTQIICANGNLIDSWSSQKETVSDEQKGLTCDKPDNPFHNPEAVVSHPQGSRIDYLLYRNNTGFEIVCEKCWVTMQQVPDKEYYYSDHEGVAAIFTVKRNITAMAPVRDTAIVEKVFTDCIPILDTGMKRIKATRVFHGIALVLSIVMFTFLGSLDMPYGLVGVTGVIRAAFVLAVGFFTINVLVMSRIEHNRHLAVRKEINTLLKCL